MPFAVLKSICEVSSEDKVHCAENLLRSEPVKKWKTEEPGEKSSFVIIEMEKLYSIKGIDIGNECSAFVEVLVGGPTCARENFKEILITCSFMTPIESRNSTNPNRVRCFNREALVQDIADQKWKLLKIICTQPFNKNIQYGLSFIKIHVDAPSETKKPRESNGISNLSLNSHVVGGFTIRENSPDSESESTTALFNRWQMSRKKDSQSQVVNSVPRIPTAATLKKPSDSFCLKKLQSTASPSFSRDKSPTEEKPRLPDRNRDSLLFTDDDENDDHNRSLAQEKQKKRLEKLEKIINADKERVSKEADKAKKSKKPDRNKSMEKKQTDDEIKRIDRVESKKESSKKTPTKQSAPSTSGQRRPSSSPRTSEKAKRPKVDKVVQYKPFNQLLHGVVLVISGIQNPDRTNIRNMALALGAKYKVDWDNSCTHLICAFKNTPKYNQVRGVGKIITRSWIEDCHSQKKRLPWRRFALDNVETAKPESEDEVFDESLRPVSTKSKPISRTNSSESDNVSVVFDRKTHESQLVSSGSDTEDEIQRALASIASQKKATKTANVFEVSTEEEDYVSKRTKRIPKTLNFFKNMTFFLSDDLSAVERIKLERQIESFHGCLTKSLNEANYAIANEPVPKGDKFKGETVKPLWILECNDSDCFIPTKRYLVT